MRKGNVLVSWYPYAVVSRTPWIKKSTAQVLSRKMAQNLHRTHMRPLNHL